MSLYYAPAFFFYLLGVSVDFSNLSQSLSKIFKLGAVVIATFAIIWFPFLSSYEWLQVLHRIFPVARGLYEDKVASFWCAMSPFIKFNQLFTLQQLVFFSFLMTVASVLVSGIRLFLRPTKDNFIFGMASSALGFFLFSFQVHEKSILLALLPSSLLIMRKGKGFIAVWMQLVAVFSMFPLLQKDGLTNAYIVAMVSLIIFGFSLFKTTIKQNKMMMLSLFGMIGIHSVYGIFPAPTKYPDIYLLAFAAYSFVHYFGLYIYFSFVI